jgi:hypothetical protein
MERKYEITAAASIVNMVFTVKKLDNGEFISIHAAVDVFNDQVYFVGDKIEGVDYDELKQDILVYLQPVVNDAPAIPPEILNKITQVQQGRFDGQNFRDF